MVKFGILKRSVFGEKPPVKVEYQLTPFGIRFKGILDEIRTLEEQLKKNIPTLSDKIQKGKLG